MDSETPMHDQTDLPAISQKTSEQAEAVNRMNSLRAIAGLAHTSDSTYDARSSIRMNVRRSRYIVSSVGIGVGILLILAIVFSIVHWGVLLPFQQSHPATVAPLAFFPEMNAVECPHDLTWSPNSSMVAIVGYQRTCLGSVTGVPNSYEFNMLQSATPGIIVIYNAHTGKLISTIHPDEMILAHITLSASVTALLGDPRLNSGPLLSFNYTHVLWSRNGRQLAVTFNGYIPTNAPEKISAQPNWPGYQMDGVLTLDVTGGSPQVLFHRFDPQHPLYTEWDLRQGIALATQPALQPSSPFSAIQPASTYRWGSDGTLQPMGAFGSDDMFASAVGSTNGGVSFSFWQPGYALSLGSDSSVGWNAYADDIAAWSPDGRYLLERGTIETLVTTSASVNAIPDGWHDAPRISGIPAGLALVYVKLGEQSPVSGADFLASQRTIMYGVPVAWNPQGTLVAAYSPSLEHVLVFDIKGGKEIASLKPIVNLNTTQSYQGAEASMLRWSPDGSRLLLYDPAIGAATIWETPQK